MRSEPRALLTAFLLNAKIAIALATPPAAWAAEQTIRHTSASDLPLLTWGFIIGFAMVGWAIADLDKVAELWNTDGGIYQQWQRRLALAKTIVASNGAGVCMFFLGKLAPGLLLGMLGVKAETPEIPEMLLLIFTTGAGYMGARWFDWLEKKVTNK